MKIILSRSLYANTYVHIFNLNLIKKYLLHSNYISFLEHSYFPSLFTYNKFLTFQSSGFFNLHLLTTRQRPDLLKSSERVER
jgi:hypothetical protein